MQSVCLGSRCHHTVAQSVHVQSDEGTELPETVRCPLNSPVSRTCFSSFVMVAIRIEAPLSLILLYLFTMHIGLDRLHVALICVGYCHFKKSSTF